MIWPFFKKKSNEKEITKKEQKSENSEEKEHYAQTREFLLHILGKINSDIDSKKYNNMIKDLKLLKKILIYEVDYLRELPKYNNQSLDTAVEVASSANRASDVFFFMSGDTFTLKGTGFDWLKYLKTNTSPSTPWPWNMLGENSPGLINSKQMLVTLHKVTAAAWNTYQNNKPKKPQNCRRGSLENIISRINIALDSLRQFEKLIDEPLDDKSVMLITSASNELSTQLNLLNTYIKDNIKPIKGKKT